MTTCIVVGCDRAVYARGLCRVDYDRWLRHDKPDLIEFANAGISSTRAGGPPDEMNHVLARLWRDNPELAARFQTELERHRAVRNRT